MTKSRKNQRKFGTRKKSVQKSNQNQFWEGLGHHLGGVWVRLGLPLGAFGRLLAVFWAFKIELLSNIGPRWAPRGLLDGFWVDFGRGLKGFREDLGGFGADFRPFGDGFGKVWVRIFEDPATQGFVGWASPLPVPATLQKAPQSSQVISQGAPKAFQGVPKVSQGAPKATQGVPKASQGIPRHPRGFPTHPQGLPRRPQGLPKASTKALPPRATLSKVSTKALPLSAKLFKMSTKALPLRAKLSKVSTKCLSKQFIQTMFVC